MKRIHILMLLHLLITSAFSQKTTILSGPMLGNIDFREATIWLQTNAPAQVAIKYWKHKDTIWQTPAIATTANKHFTAKIALTEVEPNGTYNYQILLNNKPSVPIQTYTLKTPALWKWRTSPAPVQIAIGSCHYSNQPQYDRPGKGYGDSTQIIFTSIANKNPDLMLWLGDNIYLREPDWNTRTGIYKRYTHMRSNPALQKLLSTCPQYAIWDDHDFGPNDADRGFWNKTTTLEAFKDFWANPSFGINNMPGTTTFFEREDAAFFLLDNRYYRSPNNDTLEKERTVLGIEQKQWLKDNLVSSKATFKFIAIGSQFLNTAQQHENFANYAQERQEIISFIQQYKIKNVVFLTGDRHHSEISKLKTDSLPAIYDITSSPLTSGAGNSANTENNALRVEGSLIKGQRNFAILNITGETKERILKITFFDKNGLELFKYEIGAE